MVRPRKLSSLDGAKGGGGKKNQPGFGRSL